MPRLAHLTALLLTAALGACSLPRADQPVPKQAALSRDTVVVTLSNGAACVGARNAAQATPTGWQGRLRGCGHPYRYAVTLDGRRNPVQWLLGQLFAVIGLEGALAPSGRVAVTDGQGRTTLFTSPPVDSRRP